MCVCVCVCVCVFVCFLLFFFSSEKDRFGPVFFMKMQLFCSGLVIYFFILHLIDIK